MADHGLAQLLVDVAEDEVSLAERRRGADQPFELQPAVGATLDDLGLPLFEDYLRVASDHRVHGGER